MKEQRTFTQDEVNRIVAERLMREKEKHAKLLLNVIDTLSKAADQTVPDFSKMPYDLFEAYMEQYMQENCATVEDFDTHMKACMELKGECR